MNSFERQSVDKYLDDNGLVRLKSRSLYNQSYQKAMSILELPFWNDERFARLLVPGTFIASLENIIGILTLPYWDNPNNLRFLSVHLLTINYNVLKDRIELLKRLLLGNYITSYCLGKTEEEIRALYKHIARNGMPLIIKGKLNPIFNVSSTSLLKNYGINLEGLVEMEREKKGLS